MLAEALGLPGELWDALGAIAGVLALSAPVAWGVYVYRRDRRRVVFRLRSATALVAREAADHLEVLHNGQPLEKPTVCILDIAYAGRRDIPSSAFDAGRPLQFELASPVVEVVATSPFRVGGASLRANGTKVEVAPDLLPADSSATITLLLDGVPEPVSVISPLIDIPVRPHSPSAETGNSERFKTFLSAIVAIFLIYAIVVSPDQAADVVRVAGQAVADGLEVVVDFLNLTLVGGTAEWPAYGFFAAIALLVIGETIHSMRLNRRRRVQWWR